MQRVSPLCAAIDIALSTLPFFDELRKEYAALRTMRDNIDSIWSQWDNTFHHDRCDGTKHSRFHPAKLPEAKSVPDIADMFANVSSITPPQPRVLTAIVDHAEWYELNRKLLGYDVHANLSLHQLRFDRNIQHIGATVREAPDVQSIVNS